MVGMLWDKAVHFFSTKLFPYLNIYNASYMYLKVLLSVSETLHVKKVYFSFFSEVTINKSAFPLEKPLLPLNTTYRQLQVKIISLQKWLRKWRSIDFETIIMAQIYGYEIKFKIQYKDHLGFVNVTDLISPMTKLLLL